MKEEAADVDSSCDVFFLFASESCSKRTEKSLVLFLINNLS